MTKRNSPPFWMQKTGAPVSPGMLAAAQAQPNFQFAPLGPMSFTAPAAGPGPGPGPGPGFGPPGFGPPGYFPGYFPGYYDRSYTRSSFACMQQSPELAAEFWSYMQNKRIPGRVLLQAAAMLARAGCYDEARALAAEGESRSRFRGPPWFQRRQGSPWFRPGPPVEYNPWLGTTQPYEIQQQGPYTVFVEPRPTVAGRGAWGMGGRTQTGACGPPAARTQTGACGPSGCPGGVCPIR